MHQVVVDGAVSSNPLIVWNNLFGVDDPFMEKPVAWFAQAETENCPRIKFLSSRCLEDQEMFAGNEYYLDYHN